MRRSRRMTLLAMTASLAMLQAPPTRACSVCLCGDRMYLYGHGYQLLPGRFSLSLENRYFSKSSGATEPGSETTEKHAEYRPSLVAAYGIGGNVTLTANLATSIKRLTETEDGIASSENISGLGDLQFEVMWSPELAEAADRSYALGLSAAVKVPTGDNEKMQGGARLDEHGQPGTGSWDFIGGLGLTQISLNHAFYVTAFYRINGTNDFLYHFGNVYSLNVGGDYRPGPRVALTLALNGRYAQRDQEDGEDLLSTGGSVLYLSPGLRYTLNGALSLVANVQVPVARDLYEQQDENPVYTLTFRYDAL
jgi:hypothetical protein